MNILKFPVLKFKHQGKNIIRYLKHTDLTFQDENDDWWDIWFSKGNYVYQVCGKYVHPYRFLEDLVVYVYKHGELCDENRIETIKDVSITYK